MLHACACSPEQSVSSVDVRRAPPEHPPHVSPADPALCWTLAADMNALEVEIFKARRQRSKNPRLHTMHPLRASTHSEPLVLQVVGEKAGKKDFTFTNSQLTPKVGLWTASIGMTYGA